MKLPLRDYQQRFVDYAQDREWIVNHSDKGTGKTAMMFGWIHHRAFKRTLILVESDKVGLGLNQAAKFSDLRAAGLMGTNAQRRKAVSSDFNVFYAGYASLDSQWGRILLTMPWDAVIADESTNIKQYRARQTKLAIKLAHLAPYRMVMTASMITNSLFDVWSQFYFADKGQTFGDSLWWFTKRYFYKKGFEWAPRAGAEERIRRLIRENSFRAEKKVELKDMPGKFRRPVAVDLHPTARRYYDQLVKDWMLELQDGTIIDTRHVIAKFSKLKQICSGYLNEHNRIPCTKLAMVREILSNRPACTVVWCNYTFEVDDIAEICQSLKIGAICYYGEGDAGQWENLFQTDPTIRVFITTYRKGARALTLTKASTVIRYGRNRSVEMMEQSEDRTHRIGSEHHKVISYYDIFTSQTVEETDRMALSHDILYSKKFIPVSDIKKLLKF